jgi:tripartite-type tricarboxylate transporter receptor subunit TctC
MKRRTFITGAGAAALGLPRVARAQAAWPAQTIKMIVPFPPGGQGDLAARPIAQAFERILGKPVVVDNRGGAGGAIGNAAVARGASDGHTMLMTLSSLAVLPEAARIMGREPSYEVSDLIPIGRVLADPTLLAVHPATRWKNVGELVEDAKMRPREIPYGSSGPYGTLHVSMEMFAAEAKIKLNHVAYRGAGPALNDLLSGQIKALASAPGVLKQQADAGQLRVLANFGGARVPSFPDVPTFRELGFANVEFYIWAGLFMPKTTPPEIVDRVRLALREAMADPSVRRVYEQAGSPPAYLDQPAFAEFVTKDSSRLIEAVRKIGRVEGG